MECLHQGKNFGMQTFEKKNLYLDEIKVNPSDKTLEVQNKVLKTNKKWENNRTKNYFFRQEHHLKYFVCSS